MGHHRALEAAARRMREGIGFASLVVLGWSFPGVFVRWMPKLDWVQATAGRLGVALVVILPMVLATREGRSGLRTAAMSWRVWLLASLMTVYYVTATAAFWNAPIGEVALLIASAPALVVVWHRITGHAVSGTRMLGAVVALLGVAVVALPAQFAHSHSPGNHPLGVLLALGSAACAAASALGVAGMAKRAELPPSVVLGCMTFIIGVVLLGPFALATLAQPGQILVAYWPQLAGVGLLSTALPTISYAAASERLPRGMVTIFNPVVAVTANIAAALTVGELPSIWALPGGLLVLFGVVATLREKS